MSDKTQDSLFLPEYRSAKHLLSVRRQNRIVKRVNALSNMRADASAQPGPLVVSDANSILPTSGGSGTDSTSPTRARTFRLKAVHDNYVLGHLIILSGGVIIEDTTVNYAIAKPGKLRTSLTTEVKYAITHSYSYSTGPDSWNLIRSDAYSGGTTEDQLVTPPWTQDDELIAIPAETVILDLSDNPVVWAMVNPWRQWAKIAT